MANAYAPDTQTTSLLRNLITALEDKKADQLRVLHVGGLSDITDYLILATGNSEPHLRALRIEAEKILDAAKARIAGMEQGGFNSGWTVVDAYQIMIHFFTPDQRKNYAMDTLWRDGTEVDLKTLAAKSAKPAPAAVVKVVKAAKAKVAKSAKSSAATKPAKAKAPVAAKKPVLAKKPVAAKKKPALEKPVAKVKAKAKPAAKISKLSKPKGSAKK